MKRHVILLMIIAAMLTGCKKEGGPKNNRVIVMNEKVTDIDPTRVEISGTYSYLSDLDGIYVLVSGSSDMADASAFESVLSGKSFTADVTGLKENTNYYYRYRFVSMGTEQESEAVKSFTTIDYQVPEVTTAEVTEITGCSMKCGGEVTDDGYLEVTARGVCWGTSPNPTVSDPHTTDGGGLDVTDKGVCWAKHPNPTTDDMKVSKGAGLGEFTVEMTGLEVGERYYVRAYSVNTKETKYGNEREFTTLDGKPIVTTSSVANVMATTATCGGEVTGDGGLPVTERGVCWSKTANPTVSDSHKQSGSGTGSFTVNLDNLEVDETYHVRAYAKNSHTTSYGDDVVFTTLDGKPVVTTSSVTNVMATTATCGGEVTDDGGFPVTERGVCWSTSPNPTISDSHTTDGGGTGVFTSSITGLTVNTTYYVRAYATNSVGMSYGEQKSFTTHDAIAGHEYVDLGLPSGLKWATCNVGAEHPYDYGDYYQWGGVTPVTSTSINVGWENCPGNGGSSYYNETAFSTWRATHLTNNVLNPEVDAATANWGGGWRMPTKEEWQELYDNTTSTWTTENGVYGRKFTSKTDSSKDIFLPAAGARNGTSLSGAGTYGHYWSSSLNSSNPPGAYYMGFISGSVYPQSCSRFRGLAVRPVCQ